MNRIENLRNYHAIATNPSAKEKIIIFKAKDTTIDKADFILGGKCHKHGSALSIIVSTSNMMRNKNKTRMI